MHYLPETKTFKAFIFSLFRSDLTSLEIHSSSYTMEEKICFGDANFFEPTDFDRCIICQEITDANLQRVTSMDSLHYAIKQHQDSVAKRLEPIVSMDKQDEKNMYWHGHC